MTSLWGICRVATTHQHTNHQIISHIVRSFRCVYKLSISCIQVAFLRGAGFTIALYLRNSLDYYASTLYGTKCDLTYNCVMSICTIVVLGCILLYTRIAIQVAFPRGVGWTFALDLGIARACKLHTKHVALYMDIYFSSIHMGFRNKPLHLILNGLISRFSQS